jgi:hypothetical protein
VGVVLAIPTQRLTALRVSHPTFVSRLPHPRLSDSLQHRIQQSLRIGSAAVTLFATAAICMGVIALDLLRGR